MTASLREALERATSTTAAGGAGEALEQELEELDALTRQPVEADLGALAVLQEPGEVPLLGTDLSSAAYPALLWNGERFERLGTRWNARLAFVALTAAQPGAPSTSLARAVRTGGAVRGLWPPASPPGAAAGLTTDVVCAAVCAALAAGVAAEELEPVAELAAGLLLVTATEPDADTSHLQAGHALAAGWLAVQLHHCGVVAAPGTSADVLTTREPS